MYLISLAPHAADAGTLGLITVRHQPWGPSGMIALALWLPIAGTGRLLNLPLCQATSWVTPRALIALPWSCCHCSLPILDTIRVFLSTELSISP